MIAAVVEKGAGIDVHKEFLKVCVMTGPLSEEPKFEIRRVDCSNAALEGLRRWLKDEEVTHVVMESTGPYWVPVFNILEEDVKVILANPEQVKNRKGHKTDAQDSWWLAHLLRHGMIRPSFIPEKATRELRELTRRRRKLIEQAASERNRVQKQLEYGNVKLGNELSDVFGLSGQLMLQALVNENRTAEEIAELAQGSLKKKKEQIAEAVRGQRLTETQKEVIRSCMRVMTFLDLEIEQLSVSAAKLIQQSGQQRQKELLQTIPGMQDEASTNVLAETGPDMKQFPNEGHLSSWGGVCPGDNESAGKNKSRHTTHGNPWFRTTLTESAWAASRTKGTVFEAKYESLKTKAGHKAALVAVAHLLAQTIYHVLTRGEAYRERRPQELNEVQRQRIIRHHVRRLRRLGCWLEATRLEPLKEWYVTRCIPNTGPVEAKRRGPRKRHGQISAPEGGAVGG